MPAPAQHTAAQHIDVNLAHETIVVEVVVSGAAAKSNPSAEEDPAVMQPAQHEPYTVWDAAECVSSQELELRSLSCKTDSCSLPLPPTLSTLGAAAAPAAGQTGSYSMLGSSALFLQQTSTSAQHAPGTSQQDQQNCHESGHASTVPSLHLQEIHTCAQQALQPYTMQTYAPAQGSESETAAADPGNSTQLLQDIFAPVLQPNMSMLAQPQALPTCSGIALLLTRGRRSPSLIGCLPATRGRSCSALSRPHAMHGGFRSPSPPPHYGDAQLSRLGSAQPGRTLSYSTVRQSSCTALGRPSAVHGATGSPSPPYSADAQLSRLSSAQQGHVLSYRTVHEGSYNSLGRSSAGHGGPAWAVDPNSMHGRALQTISTLSQQQQQHQSSSTSCLSALRALCSPSSKAGPAHAAPCSTEHLPPHLRTPIALCAEHTAPNKGTQSPAATGHTAAGTRPPPLQITDCVINEPSATDTGSPDSNQEPAWAEGHHLQDWWKHYTPAQLRGEPPPPKLPHQKQKQRAWQRPKLQAGERPDWDQLQELRAGQGTVAPVHVQEAHQDKDGQAQKQKGTQPQQQDTAGAGVASKWHKRAWIATRTAYEAAADVEEVLGPGHYRATKVFARGRASRSCGDCNGSGSKASSSKKGGKQGKVSTYDDDPAEQEAQDAAELQALLDEYYESQNDNLLAAYMKSRHRKQTTYPDLRRQNALKSTTTEYAATEQGSGNAQRRHSLSLAELLEMHLAAARQKQEAQEQPELEQQQQESHAPKPSRQLYTSAPQQSPQTAFYVALDREMNPEAAKPTQPTAYQAAFAALVAAWCKLHAAEAPSSNQAAAALHETGQGAAGNLQAHAVSTDVFPYDWGALGRAGDVDVRASQAELDEQEPSERRKVNELNPKGLTNLTPTGAQQLPNTLQAQQLPYTAQGLRHTPGLPSKPAATGPTASGAQPAGSSPVDSRKHSQVNSRTRSHTYSQGNSQNNSHSNSPNKNGDPVTGSQIDKDPGAPLWYRDAQGRMIISTKMWKAAAAKAGAARAAKQTSSSSNTKPALPQTTQEQQQGDGRARPVVSTGVQLPWVPHNTPTLLKALPTGAANDGDHTTRQQQQQQQLKAGARHGQLRAMQAREMALAFAQLQAAHEDLADRLAQQDLHRSQEADTGSSSSSSSRDGDDKCDAAHQHQQQHSSMWSLAAAVAASAASAATTAAAARRARVLRRHREAVQVFEYQQSLRQQGRAAVLPTGVLGRAWWAVQGLLQTELYMRYFWGGTGDSDDDEESCCSDDDKENARSPLSRGSRALGRRSSPDKGARHSRSPRRAAKASGSPGAGARPRTGSPAAVKQHSFGAVRGGSLRIMALQPWSPVN